MVAMVAILGVTVVFLGLALSACAIYVIENKGRGELRFR
jgi:Na+-transporting methylmalonyl-CoA/oxaloacetate decarboxylase gamma subunit